MSIKDKNKWNNKYREKIELLKLREPSLFVKKYASAASGIDVLDLACGVGKNSIYLANRAFNVDAVDISKIALDKLKTYTKSKVNTIEADLDNFIPEREYNIIIMTNFLDRELIKRTKKYLKSGGLYIVETYIEDKDNEKKDSNPNFLLKKDELLKTFKDNFEILEYKTFWNEPYEMHKMKKATIAACKF